MIIKFQTMEQYEAQKASIPSDSIVYIIQTDEVIIGGTGSSGGGAAIPTLELKVVNGILKVRHTGLTSDMEIGLFYKARKNPLRHTLNDDNHRMRSKKLMWKDHIILSKGTDGVWYTPVAEKFYNQKSGAVELLTAITDTNKAELAGRDGLSIHKETIDLTSTPTYVGPESGHEYFTDTFTVLGIRYVYEEPEGEEGEGKKIFKGANRSILLQDGDGFCNYLPIFIGIVKPGGTGTTDRNKLLTFRKALVTFKAGDGDNLEVFVSA